MLPRARKGLLGDQSDNPRVLRNERRSGVRAAAAVFAGAGTGAFPRGRLASGTDLSKASGSARPAHRSLQELALPVKFTQILQGGLNLFGEVELGLQLILLRA